MNENTKSIYNRGTEIKNASEIEEVTARKEGGIIEDIATELDNLNSEKLNKGTFDGNADQLALNGGSAKTLQNIDFKTGITTPFLSSPDGGTSRYKDLSLNIESGDKTFLINYIPDKNYKNKTGSKHASLFYIYQGLESVRILADGTTSELSLRVTSATASTGVRLTNLESCDIALQVTQTNVILFINGEQKAALPHTYNWLYNPTTSLRILLNKDLNYDDSLGYFVYGQISTFKILNELVSRDYSMLRSGAEITGDNSDDKYLTYPFLSSPDGGTTRYINNVYNLPKGDKTFVVNYLPDDNYRNKTGSKHTVLFNIFQSSESVRIQVDGTTSELSLRVTSATALTGVRLTDLVRCDIALQVTATDVVLFINGEQKATLPHTYDWLYNPTTDLRIVLNKDLIYDDSSGYFFYGLISSLTVTNALIIRDYSLLEGYPISEGGGSIDETKYTRIIPTMQSSTQEMTTAGILSKTTNIGENLFFGSGTLSSEGNKEIRLTVSSQNCNLPSPYILDCGSAIVFGQTSGRTINNEWVHPDIAYCGETGIGGYKYWLVNSCYPGAQNSFEDEELFVSNDGTTWKRVLPSGTAGETTNLPPHSLVTSGIRTNCLLPIPAANTPITMNGQTVTPIRTLKHDPAIMFDNGYLYIYLFYNFTISPDWLNLSGEGHEKRFTNLIRTNNGKDWEVVRSDGSTFALTAESSLLLFTQTNGVNNYIRFIDRPLLNPTTRTEDRGYSIVKVSDNEYYAYLDNYQYGTSGVSRYKGTSPYSFDWDNREVIDYPSRITKHHISVRYYNSIFYLIANGELYTSQDGITFTKSASKIWRGGINDNKYKATFAVNGNGTIIYACGLLGVTLNKYPSDANQNQIYPSYRSRTIFQQFASIADMSVAVTGGYADIYIDMYNRNTAKSYLAEGYGITSANGIFKKTVSTQEIEQGEYDVTIWGNVQVNDNNPFGIAEIDIK